MDKYDEKIVHATSHFPKIALSGTILNTLPKRKLIILKLIFYDVNSMNSLIMQIIQLSIFS